MPEKRQRRGNTTSESEFEKVRGRERWLTASYIENEKYEGINKGKIDRIMCESGRYERKE